MLTRVLALELGRYNIRVNAIAPGIVRTEFSKGTWADTQKLKQLEDEIPLKHLGDLRDVVGAAQFLASDASNYVTGQTIVVDGGWISL